MYPDPDGQKTYRSGLGPGFGPGSATVSEVWVSIRIRHRIRIFLSKHKLYEKPCFLLFYDNFSTFLFKNSYFVLLNVTLRSRCTTKMNWSFLNLKVAGSGSPSLRHNTFFWKVPPPKRTFSAKLKTEKVK